MSKGLGGNVACYFCVESENAFCGKQTSEIEIKTNRPGGAHSSHLRSLAAASSCCINVAHRVSASWWGVFANRVLVH